MSFNTPVWLTLMGGAQASAPVFNPISLSPLAWWDPSDLATLWQDTSGTIPVTTDGQGVARIDDKSGNGYHATQSTEALRPIYRTSGGLHWLDFDGSQDVLLWSAPATQVAAAAAVRVASGQTGYRGIASTAVGGTMLLAAVDGGNWGTFGGSTRPANTDIKNDTTNVLVMEGTSSGTFYINGVSDGTYAATAGQSGHIGGAGGQNTAMRLYGLLFKASAFGSDRTNLQTWLAAKAGI